MKQHRFDPLSFIFGVTFIVLAGLFAMDAIGASLLNLRWALALFLVGVGLATLFSTRGRSSG